MGKHTQVHKPGSAEKRAIIHRLKLKNNSSSKPAKKASRQAMIPKLK